MMSIPLSSQLRQKEAEAQVHRAQWLLDRALTHVAERTENSLDEELISEVRARFSVDSVSEYSNWSAKYANNAIELRKRLHKLVEKYGAAIGGVALLIACFTYALAAITHNSWLPAYHSSNWWFSAGALLLSAFFFLTSRFIRQPILAAERQARDELRRAENRLAVALRTEAEALISAVLNERWQQSRGQMASLDSEDAPILVELETVDAVPSKSAQEIFNFVEEHRTSAIGLSGIRGVGKSTIMHSVLRRDPENYLGIYIPVPVQYDATEFFRSLFREVAATIQRSNPVGLRYLERHGRIREQNIAFVRLLFGFACMAAGMATWLYSRTNDALPVKFADIPGILLFLTGAGVLVVTVRSSTAVRRRLSMPLGFLGPRYEHSETSLATRALRMLDYSSTRQTSSKNAFTWNFFTMEDQHQLELAERELTHPELVARFKDFVSEYVRSSPREIVIALDELDKMERAEDALAFVNSIKDLLHIQGVHFLVSVSEDALHSFSLRGVPVRDAFDSTFDAIIPVERFTIDESRNLLKRRVVGFPDSLSLFCHAMSGGVPRDLIRTARHCVSLRRDSDGPVPVDEIVWTVIRRHAALICEALVARTRQSDIEASRLWLASLASTSSSRDATSLVTSLERASRQVQQETPASSDAELARNAAAYFQCISTLCAYFSKPRTNGEWEQEEQEGSSIRITEIVATAMRMLHFDSTAALSAIAGIRSELGLLAQG